MITSLCKFFRKVNDHVAVIMTVKVFFHTKKKMDNKIIPLLLILKGILRENHYATVALMRKPDPKSNKCSFQGMLHLIQSHFSIIIIKVMIPQSYLAVCCGELPVTRC